MVLVAIKDINYKQRVSVDNVKLAPVMKKLRCKALKREDVIGTEYRAKHYITKGSILCKKDVYIPTKNRLLFNFGSIEIERNGKLIRETDEYIRIKNDNGKVEKIYKDGRL